MSTIGDLCVITSVSSGDKLPIWSNANGVTRALPISVLDSRYLTQADIASLAASPTTETFVAGTDFTPGVSLALTLANQFFSVHNIEVFFDAAYQGPDQYSLIGLGLAFSSPIPLGVERVYVRGGETRIIAAPSDGTVTDESLAPGSNVAQGIPGDGKVTDVKVSPLSKLFNRINDSVSITDFGGSPSNPNNTAALLAAIAACPAGRKHVYIPKGKWNFVGTAAYTMGLTSEAVMIYGAGADITELSWASGNGLKLNYLGPFNSVHMRDLTFTTGAIVSGSGLWLNQTASSIPNPALNALSTVRDCVFRGSDGYVIADTWDTGLHIFGVSNVNVTSCAFLGNAALGGAGRGIFIEGVAGLPPVAFNVVSCNFAWNDVGIDYGNFVQGLSVVSSNFTGGNFGISNQPGLTELDQLTVTASQFNQILVNIHEQTNIANTMIMGNEFIIQSNAIGINLPAAGFYSVVGNTIGGNGFTNTNGISIDNSSSPGIITGNAFLGLTTAVNLQAASSGANVQSNSYASCSNTVVNSGTGNTVGGGSQ
jgi:hypothetical protein